MQNSEEAMPGQQAWQHYYANLIGPLLDAGISETDAHRAAMSLSDRAVPLDYLRDPQVLQQVLSTIRAPLGQLQGQVGPPASVGNPAAGAGAPLVPRPGATSNPVQDFIMKTFGY